MKWIRDRPHAVYRHYADSGVLLYVGRSYNPDKRWGDLRRSQGWARYSVRRDDEWYPNMERATEAEQEAMRTEDPMFNLQCMPGAVRKFYMHRERTLHLADGRTVLFFSESEQWYEAERPDVSHTVGRWTAENAWMMGGGM